MTPEQKKRAFQRFKQMTTEQFWNEMNYFNTKAYEMAVKHYTEASEIVLTPKQQKLLHTKATEIREMWDNINYSEEK